MLLRGGELDGVRLLGSRTVTFMTRNHLPGGKDLGELSTGGFAETILDGVGFGLGFAVTLDPVPARVPTTEGSYYWGGLASTAFWIDPAEELTVMMFAQLAPSSTLPAAVAAAPARVLGPALEPPITTRWFPPIAGFQIPDLAREELDGGAVAR